MSWRLGRLDDEYGDRAFYVHLQRDTANTARSFLARFDRGIIHAYSNQIIMGGVRRNPATVPMDFCVDYCNTVNANIRHFLKDKSRWMTFRLENAKSDFALFWDRIGAVGDQQAALAEWNVRYNATPVPQATVETG